MNPQTSIELREFISGGEPSATPVASVVVLHGLGADGADFVPVAQAMDLSAIGPVRFVLPSAPVRPVSINGGYEMRAWYDIFPPGDDPAAPRREDEAGLRESHAIVQQLLDREAERGVPPGRTVLMGFSQGCAMTLLTGLRSPHRLAGLVALSGYLPLSERTAEEATEAGRSLPVFMAHGTDDAMVAVERGQAAREAVSALGCAVQWHSYPMGHEVCMEEIRDLNDWLLGVLAA
jgi:phospholipase/carboxylesterase